MEIKKEDCFCGSGEYIIMACAGASNVGQIPDLVTRKFCDDGV